MPSSFLTIFVASCFVFLSSFLISKLFQASASPILGQALSQFLVPHPNTLPCMFSSQHGDYWLIGKTIQIREEMSYNGSLSRQQTAMLRPPWKLCSWKLTRIDKCTLTKSRSSHKEDSEGSGIQELQIHVELFKCVFLWQKSPWSHLLTDYSHQSLNFHLTLPFCKPCNNLHKWLQII